jgi:hypothetical protein
MCVSLWRFATEIVVRSVITLGIGSSQTTVVEQLLCKRVVLRISIGLKIGCIWQQGRTQRVCQLHMSYLHVAIIMIIKPPPSYTPVHWEDRATPYQCVLEFMWWIVRRVEFGCSIAFLCARGFFTQSGSSVIFMGVETGEGAPVASRGRGTRRGAVLDLPVWSSKRTCDPCHKKDWPF